MKNGDHLTRVDVAPVWVDVVGETNQHVARIKEMSTLCVYVVYLNDYGGRGFSK
jgi:hypothetical protein